MSPEPCDRCGVAVGERDSYGDGAAFLCVNCWDDDGPDQDEVDEHAGCEPDAQNYECPCCGFTRGDA